MNWQPKTDCITARVDEDVCMLLASRRSPEELLQVVFLEPHLVLALELAQARAFVQTAVLGKRPILDVRTPSCPKRTETFTEQKAFRVGFYCDLGLSCFLVSLPQALVCLVC